MVIRCKACGEPWHDPRNEPGQSKKGKAANINEAVNLMNKKQNMPEQQLQNGPPGVAADRDTATMLIRKRQQEAAAALADKNRKNVEAQGVSVVPLPETDVETAQQTVPGLVAVLDGARRLGESIPRQ